MPDAKIKISSEFDKKGVEQAKQGMAGFGSVASGVFVGMMSWTAAIAVLQKTWDAVKQFAEGSLKAWGEQEAASNALAQALKNQGIYTKEVAADLEAYASELQKTTTFGDEQITKVMASLTAYGLQGDELKEVTKATLDLSQATGMDLKAAGDLVAKSVGSSTNALARYGVQIDTSASKTEKAHQVAANISKLYGGQAAAAADTYAGKQKQLANAFGDLQEEVGKHLAPAVTELNGVFVDGMTVLVQWFSGLMDGVKTVWDFLGAVDNATGVFTAFGNVVKFVWDNIAKQVIAGMERWQKLWDKLSDAMKRFTKDHQKSTEDIKKDEAEQQKTIKTTTVVTQKELDAQVKAHAKALDERSKKAKKYWDNELDLAGKDLKAQEKIIEQALKDKRLQHDELVELQHSLAKKRLEIQEQENEKVKALSEDMARSFMESADKAQFSWETTAQKIATVVLTKAVQPIAQGLQDALGNFGDVASIVGVGIGGFVGSLVGGFINLLKDHSKSVAEWSKDAYTDMVEKTNAKLDDIGKVKSEVSRAIDLVKKMQTGNYFEGQGIFGFSEQQAAIQRVTGVDISRMTREQALKTLGGMLMKSTREGFSAEASELAQYETPEAKAVMALLAKDSISMAETVGIPQDQVDWAKAVLGVDLRSPDATTAFSRDTGMGGWSNETKGKYLAGLKRYKELKSTVGGSELSTVLDLLRLGEETGAAIPSTYATGGRVQKTGIALVHEGETVVPRGGNSTIGGNTFNFTINGVNWTNEEQKKAVAKQLSGYIMKYVNGDVRLPNGAERRL